MKVKTHKICAAPGCENEFKLYRTTDKFCSPKCKREQTEQKPRAAYKINKYSKKRGPQVVKYSKERRIFLEQDENKICFVEGCGKLANTIEHTAGRANDMLLNKKYWRPCCLEHNLEFETNPALSKIYQLSKLTKKKKL